MKHHNLVTINTERQIVNANIGISNIVDMTTAEDNIIETLDTIGNILKSHCGPTAQLAMLLDASSAGEAFQPSLFTRDGIKILSDVEYMSPLQRYIKEMITYIGSRVDYAAHDGTTSSMLTATIFMKKFMEYRKTANISVLSHYEINQVIEETFASVFKTLTDKYGYDYATFGMDFTKENISEENAMLSAGKIAFIQALSSSGGNVDLALAVKRIFENSPRVSWDFIEAYTSMKENGKPYTVEIDQFDMRLKTSAASGNAMNAALGTQYIAENTRVVVLIDGMTDDGIITDQLLRYLENYPKDQNIIVVSQVFSGRFSTFVNTYNGVRDRMHQIVLWQYSPDTRLAGSPYPVELLVLAAAAGIEPCGHGWSDDFTEASTFVANEVKWQDGNLFFTGIHGLHTDHSGCLHPYFADLKNAPRFYQEAVEFLNAEIDEYRSGHRPDGQMYGAFMMMLSRIACLRRPILRLGGPIHEQTTNLEIQKDVQGAIMASLATGFTIDGPRCLLSAICDEKKNKAIDTDVSEYVAVEQFKQTILSILEESVREVLTTIYPDCDIDGSVDKTAYINAFTYATTRQEYKLDDYLEKIKDLPDEITNGLEFSQLYAKNYPVMQPLMIVKELFKRIQELILKFNNTNKIIVSGGVVVNTPKE